MEDVKLAIATTRGYSLLQNSEEHITNKQPEKMFLSWDQTGQIALFLSGNHSYERTFMAVLLALFPPPPSSFPL